MLQFTFGSLSASSFELSIDEYFSSSNIKSQLITDLKEGIFVSNNSCGRGIINRTQHHETLISNLCFGTAGASCLVCKPCVLVLNQMWMKFSGTSHTSFGKRMRIDAGYYWDYWSDRLLLCSGHLLTYISAVASITDWLVKWTLVLSYSVFRHRHLTRVNHLRS